jgi:hypothetical protein
MPDGGSELGPSVSVSSVVKASLCNFFYVGWCVESGGWNRRRTRFSLAFVAEAGRGKKVLLFAALEVFRSWPLGSSWVMGLMVVLSRQT